MNLPPLERWGINAQLVTLPGGHRNLAFKTADPSAARTFVFKSTRRSEAALRWLTAVQDMAREAGFVVPGLIESRNGLLAESGWTCEPFIEGDPFPPGEIHSILPTIAAFHRASATCPQRPGFLSSQDLLVSMHGGDVDLRHLPAALARTCRDAWKAVAGQPQAVIHGDLNPDNLIRCRDGRIALIDWDESRRDLTLFDEEPLGTGGAAHRRARLAWEVASSWMLEPAYAQEAAARLLA